MPWGCVCYGAGGKTGREMRWWFGQCNVVETVFRVCESRDGTGREWGV